MIATTPSTPPALSISLEKVCFIIAKAHEIDVKDVVDDPSYEEAKSSIDALSEDEQVDLVTLAWLGRDDNSVADWDELREEAARAHNDRTSDYLLGMPLLADQLEDALAQLGLSCED